MEPRRLAARQLELDRQRTARFPALMARKLARMKVSPLAFLRGAAPLFYELLAADPDLAAGPDGSGFIQGDAHLENFGAYSSALHEGEVWKKGHATGSRLLGALLADARHADYDETVSTLFGSAAALRATTLLP